MRHFARYYLPGSFFPETTVKEIPERSPELARDMAPASAFAFILYDTAEPAVVAEQVAEDFELLPKQKNVSSRYYLGGQVFDLPQLREFIDSHGGDAAHFGLYSNVAGNGYTRAILCHTGNWQPLEHGDVVMLEEEAPCPDDPDGQHHVGCGCDRKEDE